MTGNPFIILDGSAVEQMTVNHWVAGSNPAPGAIILIKVITMEIDIRCPECNTVMEEKEKHLRVYSNNKRNNAKTSILVCNECGNEMFPQKEF